MSRGRIVILLLTLVEYASNQQCKKLRDLLDWGYIHPAYSDEKTNNICVLDRMSCCSRKVEQEMLTRTKYQLDNIMYLVINKFLKDLDKDRFRKQSLLRNMILRMDTSDKKKVDITNKIYKYINGDINSISSQDLIRNDWITGMLSRCQVSSPSSNVNLRYIESVILMLRGYNMMSKLITAVTNTNLTETCYVAAVKSGFKFAGCEQCSDATAFAGPCVQLCSNVVNGCLKSHIKSQKLITYFTANQVILNNLVMSLNQEIDTTISRYEGQCIRAQLAREQFNDTSYITKLGYTEKDAKSSLDARWLCTYVFNGISKVNCWNGTHLDRYYGRTFEFTDEGQKYNPVVEGEGLPVENIDELDDQYNWFDEKVRQLKLGNDILVESGALSTNSFSVLYVSLVFGMIALT